MTRIASTPDFTINPQNESLFKTEQIVLDSVPYAPSSLVFSGAWVGHKPHYDHLNTLNASSINYTNLKLNRTRRPFFEDQYHTIRGDIDQTLLAASSYHIASGVIAADEYPAVPLNYADFSASTIPTIKKLGDMASVYFNDIPITVSGASSVNTIYRSMVMGGPISWWKVALYPAPEVGEDDNEFLISQRGYGWGRNLAQNEFIYELLSSVTQTYPPLPSSTYNPIAGDTALPIDYTKVYTGGSYNPPGHFPEKHESGMSNTASPIYTKTTRPTTSSLVLEHAVRPNNWFTKNPDWGTSGITGFGNGANGGGSYINPVQFNSMVYYSKVEVNTPIEGVSRVLQSAHRPWRFYKDLYYNLSSAGAHVSSLLTGQEIYTTYACGPFTDTRINQVKYYSPETLQEVTISGVGIGTSSCDPGNQIITCSHLMYGSFDSAAAYMHLTTRTPNTTRQSLIATANNSSGLFVSSSYQSAISYRDSDNPITGIYANLEPMAVGVVMKTHPDESLNPYTYANKPASLAYSCQKTSWSGTLGQASFEYIPGWAASSLTTDQLNDYTDSASFGIQTVSPFIAFGWQHFQYFIIVDKTLSGVKSKIDYLYANGYLDDEPTDASIPTAVKNLCTKTDSCKF